MDALYQRVLVSISAHPGGYQLLQQPLFENECVQSRVEAGAYPDPHVLYLDLRAATRALLSMLPLGSMEYIHTSACFRFASDLLLREVSRLSLSSPTGPQNTGDQIVARLGQYVDLIAADIDQLHGEAFFAPTQAGPLFSSLTHRSCLDPNETEEAGIIHTTKVLAHAPSLVQRPLGSAVPMAPRVPHPTVPPTEMLSSMMRPLSVGLPIPKALEEDVYASSIGPAVDSQGALLPVQQSIDVLTMRETEKKETPPPAPAPPSDEAKAVPPAQSPLESRTSEEPAAQPQPGDGLDVDLAAVLAWQPSHFVDDDELEAAQKGTEVQLLSRLLLELQYLQRERLAAPSVNFVIGDEEQRIAHKVANITARLLEGGAKTQTTPSPKMPVLLKHYAGVLPAADASQGRLAGLDDRKR